ncbi:M81 family metallopeptidase [Pseudooceanicola aestuarii]|uniref:M81 family metallopeptidase n=1 Tax=Pseudooceanicola aestuarii TaxID=2697319 RepID=UPI0013D58887|nr:M81 family metallopeptidase [Pseudooceanicola aestuarii]
MKVAIASFEFEGNSLSLRVARKTDFARFGIFQGAEIPQVARGKQLAITGGIDTLTEAGAEVVPIYMSRCVSGGHVDDAYFDEVVQTIADGITAALPLDGVYLSLHGAMICATEKDPEGGVIAAVRDRLGDASIPIAVSLDLHAHVTQRMADMAQIIVGYETYPHVDAYRTGACAAGLLVRAMRGEIAPVTRIAKYNAIVPVLGGATLGDEPMAQVAAVARGIEAEGRALSVSYFPVQPWLDMADVGITGLAITDGDAPAASAAAQTVLDAMWTRRRDFELPAVTPAEAVRAAIARPDRTLIIDAPDSMGAGAQGDSPALLAALLDISSETEAALFIVDAETVARATELGEGAEADFRIGAKEDDRWFSPCAVRATVERLCDGAFTYSGGPAAGATTSTGPTAVLRHGGIRILVGSLPFYEHMDEHYAAAGIDITTCKIASFKNLMNYRKLLGPGVRHIALHGPGGAPLRLQDVDWAHRQRPYWPADDMEPPAPAPAPGRTQDDPEQ